MTRRTWALGAGGLLVAPSGGCQSAAVQSPDPTLGKTVTFEEQFTKLDRTLWHAGPKTGAADPGFYGRSAFARYGGEEGFDPYAIVADADASNGSALRISAKYIGRPMNVPSYFGNQNREMQWISGNIQTATPDGQVRAGWRRGYFEARMRFPDHPLTWPAFWMLNKNCILQPATSVELDVVEHKGWEHQLYGAYMHEHGQPGERHAGTAAPTRVDVTKAYYRYGMLVEDDWCAPYFERRPVLQTSQAGPEVWRIGRSIELDRTQDVFWPLLTLAMRIDVPFPEPLRPEHDLAHMFVDYVRVYQ